MQPTCTCTQHFGRHRASGPRVHAPGRGQGEAGHGGTLTKDHEAKQQAGHAQAPSGTAQLAPRPLVPGMELSCSLDGSSLHCWPTCSTLTSRSGPTETRRIRERPGAARQGMVDRLADLGVGITWEQVAAIAGSAVVGRPHLARAMVASGAITGAQRGLQPRLDRRQGGRAYVGRYALDPVLAIRLVRAAGGVAVVAHPRAGRDFHVSDDQIAMLAAAGLAGAEVFHPDQRPNRSGPACWALARALGLAATGGSDDHGRLTGHRIGAQTTPAEAYETASLPGRRTRPLCRVLFSNGHHIAAHQGHPYCLP